MALFEVRNLEKYYPVTEGVFRREVGQVRAVDGISFDVEAGETVGIVGESGCGKSTAATAMLRLEEPTGGEVFFDGESVIEYSKTELKRFRRRAQMIFQDPTSSFDPRMSIGESVAEPLRIHGMRDRHRRRRIVEDLLERVGLSANDADRYPHELSGGMKQRVALARALSVNPDLLVADEPVSALDVSVKAEILALLSDLQAEFDLAVVLISHDMSVVRQICDRVNVMYLGEIVEQGRTEAVFEAPSHPYTEALMSSIPQPDPRRRQAGIELTGEVPSPSNPPPGCRFHTRCPRVIPPDGYDFEDGEWRRVMDLRGRLRRGTLDVEELLERHGASTIETADGEAIATAVRAEFSLPERLADPTAESVLEEVLSDVVDGDDARARERLAEAFSTVCERDHPELRSLGAGRTAACHLHDGARVEDAPLAED